MELGIAIRSHIRDMNIANAPIGKGMYCLAILLNPLSIAGLPLACQRLHGNHTRFFGLRRLNRQLHLVPGLVHQQFLRAAGRIDTLPIDG